MNKNVYVNISNIGVILISISMILDASPSSLVLRGIGLFTIIFLNMYILLTDKSK